MPHSYEPPGTGYDDYVIRMAAKTDAEEAALLEHDAEVLTLTRSCPACGFRGSPQTWHDYGTCPNCRCHHTETVEVCAACGYQLGLIEP